MLIVGKLPHVPPVPSSPALLYKVYFFVCGCMGAVSEFHLEILFAHPPRQVDEEPVLSRVVDQTHWGMIFVQDPEEF